MTYLDVLTHTSFLEQILKTTWLITVILHIHDLQGCAFSIMQYFFGHKQVLKTQLVLYIEVGFNYFFPEV